MKNSYNILVSPFKEHYWNKGTLARYSSKISGWKKRKRQTK